MVKIPLRIQAYLLPLILLCGSGASLAEPVANPFTILLEHANVYAKELLKVSSPVIVVGHRMDVDANQLQLGTRRKLCVQLRQIGLVVFRDHFIAHENCSRIATGKLELSKHGVLHRHADGDDLRT